MNVKFAAPDIGKEEVDAVTRVLEKGWLTMGEETLKFEEEFASYVKAKHSISVNSCTSGLFLALKFLDIKSDDEVIVPSFTFAASANVVVHCGGKPVFVDIVPENFTLDPKDVLRKISKKTKAIMPVHYAGNLAETDFPKQVIEDSAHRIVKNYGSKNIVCYSFYATKNLTTGEGGMITTDDVDVAEWLVKGRLHGLSKDAWKRYDSKGGWFYTVEFSGYKFNTIDLLAALGRIQLKRLGEMEEKRKRIIASYNKVLKLDNKGTHLYPILVEQRDEFMSYMKEKGIYCSFHFTPLHLSPAFKNINTPSLPVTEFVGERIVTIPLSPVLKEEEVEYICDAILKFGKFEKDKYSLNVLNR